MRADEDPRGPLRPLDGRHALDGTLRPLQLYQRREARLRVLPRVDTHIFSPREEVGAALRKQKMPPWCPSSDCSTPLSICHTLAGFHCAQGARRRITWGGKVRYAAGIKQGFRIAQRYPPLSLSLSLSSSLFLFLFLMLILTPSTLYPVLRLPLSLCPPLFSSSDSPPLHPSVGARTCDSTSFLSCRRRATGRRRGRAPRPSRIDGDLVIEVAALPRPHLHGAVGGAGVELRFVHRDVDRRHGTRVPRQLLYHLW